MADTHIKINPNEDRRVQLIAAAGQTEFPYDYPIFDDDDVAVYEFENDIETKLVKTTQYTVDGVESQTGGNIILVTGATSGVQYTIQGERPIARTSDFQDSGDFQAKTVNDELDILTVMIQELSRDLKERALILIPSVDDDFDNFLPVPVADNVLGWENVATPTKIVNYPRAAVTGLPDTHSAGAMLYGSGLNTGIFLAANSLLADSDAEAHFQNDQVILGGGVDQFGIFIKRGDGITKIPYLRYQTSNATNRYLHITNNDEVRIGNSKPTSDGANSLLKADVLDDSVEPRTLDETLTTLTESGGDIAWDWEASHDFQVTLDGNHNFPAPTNLARGTRILIITQGGSGGYDPTWNAVFKGAPTISSSVGQSDILAVYSDGTSLWPRIFVASTTL